MTETVTHRGPPPSAELAASADTATRQMVDSAYPLAKPPPDPAGPVDIVLIYAGGDTIHPWTPAEVKAMPERYRWPCWVRSNPATVDATVDAGLFVAWLHAFGCPMGTCVVLDLETAVNVTYVTTFNLVMREAGFKVTKYGSQDYIWKNPKTDGGTYLALPGPDAFTGEGDEVARQYAFDGNHDLSIVKPQSVLPLWDTRPPKPAGPYRHVTRRRDTIAGILTERKTTVQHLAEVTAAAYTAADLMALDGLKLPAGIPYYTSNP